MGSKELKIKKEKKKKKKSTDIESVSSPRDTYEHGVSLIDLQSHVGNSGAIQLLRDERFTEEGATYREGILDGEWGSYIEAHTLATFFNVSSYIYVQDDRGGLQQVAEIGNGQPSDYALLWVDGNHYQVISVSDEAYTLVHDPEGKGDCLYESMIYITKPERAPHIVSDENTRLRFISFMRTTAYSNIDPELANIAGDDEFNYHDVGSAIDEIDIIESVKIISSLEEDYTPSEWKRSINKKGNVSLLRRDGTTKRPVGIDQSLKAKKIDPNIISRVMDILKDYGPYKDEEELKIKTEKKEDVVIKFNNDKDSEYDVFSFKDKAETDSSLEMRDREISKMLRLTQGKVGPMYYPAMKDSQTVFIPIGDNTHYHASSRSGVTIVFSRESTGFIIHAIMKHSKHNKLKKTATYEVVKSYNPTYVEGHKIGYKK